MLKYYEYKIIPSEEDKLVLDAVLKICCWLYNHLVDYVNESWSLRHKFISMYEMCKYVTQLKKFRPMLKLVYSQVLQNVAVQVDITRKNSRSKDGLINHIDYHDFNSLTFLQYPNGIKFSQDDSFLKFSKIGNIPIEIKKIPPNINRCIIKRVDANRWLAVLGCNIDPSTDNWIGPNGWVGIDLGIRSFITLSNGQQIKKPFPSKNAKWIRKQALNILKSFDFIVIENIDVLKKVSIHDKEWIRFYNILGHHARLHQKSIIQVNPAWTSQYCSRCFKKNKQRNFNIVYTCRFCNLEIDRDVNAARNILALGRKKFCTQ